jgi:hypothetical protein
MSQSNMRSSATEYSSDWLLLFLCLLLVYHNGMSQSKRLVNYVGLYTIKMHNTLGG